MLPASPSMFNRSEGDSVRIPRLVQFAESTVESDLGGLAVAVDQLRTLLSELETPSYSTSVDILNGQHYLSMTGHPNRNRTQFTDCVIDFLIANLSGS